MTGEPEVKMNCRLRIENRCNDGTIVKVRRLEGAGRLVKMAYDRAVNS